MAVVATIILIARLFLKLGIAIGWHGKTVECSFWGTLFSTIVSLVLYYFAGLFDKFF